MNLNAIQNSINTFAETPLREASTRLLNTLGYHSNRTGNEGMDTQLLQSLREAAAARRTQELDRLCMNDWENFHLICQIADDEINRQETLFEPSTFDENLMLSYIFVAIQLNGENYTRTQLADITRFINTRFVIPIMVMFRYGDVLTLAIINRRWHKRDETKRVLEKVTLIKDINLRKPHRAHLDILAELHLEALLETEEVRNFDTLHKAWEAVLSTETLNRKFYRELYEWYDWAKSECRFPDDEAEPQVIRMITRLLFVWFLKEKGLVPAALFTKAARDASVGAVSNRAPQDTLPVGAVSNRAPQEAYYKAILQNLFFATLNTPISERAFSTGDNRNHRDASKYRYADLLREPEAFLEKLKQVPFVNGGLFDCLDTFEATRNGGVRVDCFTDNPTERQKLHVPDKLFFQDEKGLFPLFSRYKFTVEENTPIEQEVALEPELLGRVFENLLGDYNPETQSSARKSTGSYYTPRQIVDYMVDEALIAYFLQKVEPFDENRDSLEKRLRENLLAYEAAGDEHLIRESEVTQLIKAIDALKILDPGVGSGAFPMGILNKLVLILKKLDPGNERWKQYQIEQAYRMPDNIVRNYTIAAIERAFAEENRHNDYGRKLSLIQKSIYGVDIQPIAVTIAKLRFFISLIIEQVPNDNADDNFGIQPLPNLEIRFVAADTLIGLKRTDFQMLLETDAIEQKRQEISKIRENYFGANTRQQKLSLMRQEEGARIELVNALTGLSTEWALDAQTGVVNEAQKIAQWNPYDRNAVADFFDAEWMFGVKDGFDIIIGNPPYIRQEKILHLKPALREQYGDFFSSTADISVYFYKRATELLKKGGIFTYICTNKFMRSGYGKNLRQFLTSDVSLQALLDFGSVQVFDAAVNTCIVRAEKRPPEANHTFGVATLRDDSDDFNIRKVFQAQAFPMQNTQLSPKEWTLASPEVLALLEKLQSTGTPLGESVQGRLYFGIKSGYDTAFVIDNSTHEQLIAADANSRNLIKPLLRGRTIRKWKTDAPDEYLIVIASSANRQWPWTDAEEEEAERIFSKAYPAIHQHLAQHRQRLDIREDRGKFYWELRSCDYYEAFDVPKVIYPGTAKSFYGCYDTAGTYGLASTWTLQLEDLALLAILNSRLFDWYARHKFQSLDDPWAGGRLGFKKVDMLHVPIADRNSEQQAQLTRWVEQILAAPTSDAVPALEHAIDELVYEVYGLTDAEIALIEKTYRDAGMALPEPGELPEEKEDMPMRLVTRDDIQSIGDEASLMQFLDEKLGLPIPEGLSLGDIATRFSPYSLGLSGEILSCEEISGAFGEPSGIFLLRFGEEPDDVEIVRRVSVALDKRGRNPADFGFICAGENYQPFTFAYFSDVAGGDWQNAELTVFSWTEEKTVVHTGAEHVLPDVFFSATVPELPDDPPVPPQINERPADEALLDKLRNAGKSLGMRWTIRGGVVSGYDEAFTIDALTRDELIAEDDKSSELIAPLLRLEGKWRTDSESAYMIWIPRSGNKLWPWSDINAEDEAEAKRIFARTYPAISAHLDLHIDRLKARKNQGKFYWEYPSGTLHKLPEHPKIVYPHRGISMPAGYEPSGALPFGGSQFILTEDLFLLAILNGTLFDWYARAKYRIPDKPNTLSLKKENLKSFPVPRPTDPRQLEALAEYVQLILDEPDSREVPALEEEIDALVYNLYRLTPAEIAIIEGN